MSLLHDFKEELKAKGVPVEAYYSDDVGRYAFRVTIDGERFVCVARTSKKYDDRLSIMSKVAGEAQTLDAKVLVRYRDERWVFDPVAILHAGEKDEPEVEARRERGEEWVEFPTEIGCDFADYVDGFASPMRVTELTAF